MSFSLCVYNNRQHCWMCTTIDTKWCACANQQGIKARANQQHPGHTACMFTNQLHVYMCQQNCLQNNAIESLCKLFSCQLNYTHLMPGKNRVLCQAVALSRRYTICTGYIITTSSAASAYCFRFLTKQCTPIYEDKWQRLVCTL